MEIYPKIICWILLLFFESVLSDGGPPPLMLTPREQRVNVRISTPVGSEITQVYAARSTDPNSEYKYSIRTSEPEYEGFFAIDEKTGAITLNKSLSSLEQKLPETISVIPAVWNGYIKSAVQILVTVVPDNYTDTIPVQSNLPPWQLGGGLSPSRTILTLPPSSKPAEVPSSSVVPVESSTVKDTLTTKPQKKGGKGGDRRKPSSIEEGEINTHSNFPSDVAGETSAERAEREHEERERREREQQTGPDLKFLWLLLPGVVLCAAGLIACICHRKRMKIRKEKLPVSKSFSSETGQTIFKEEQFAGKGSYPEFFKPPLQMAVSNRYLYRRRSGDRSANTQIQTGPDGYLHPTIPEETWEFPRVNIKLKDKIGEGCFGQVFVAEAEEVAGRVTTVAIKMLKDHASEKEKQDLMAELNVMKGLDAHPNIVELLGCCTDQDPVMVIMEYVSLGKLQSFLRRSRNGHYYGNVAGTNTALEAHDLTSFACQVAKAMEYLSTRGILHRDLAARNILVNENRVCKVCDFGLARDVINSHIYERKSEGRLPVRWMAPESLFDNIFSVKTDVWSFGILMWEIVTLGSTPYPGKSAQEVMRLVGAGDRLQQPSHCKRELWNIMFYCWNANAEERPTFGELVQRLESLLDTEENYLDLNKFPENSYYNMEDMSGEKV